jgi:mono/diheme cytochrome c family protein
MPPRCVSCCATLLLPTLLLVSCGPDRPPTRTPEGKADGRLVYELYCVGCHGNDGRRGAGSMQIVNGKPGDPAEIRGVVENGRNDMPAWKQRLAADEVTAVVEHVRSLESGASSKED